MLLPDSVFNHPRLKSRFTLLLASLFVIMGIMVSTGLRQNNVKGHIQNESFSRLQMTQSDSLIQSLFTGLPTTKQSSQDKSGSPLFMFTPLSEDTSEESELTLKNLLALIGFLTFYSLTLALKQLNLRALMCMFSVVFSPLAGLRHSPTFILLQVFRL